MREAFLLYRISIIIIEYTPINLEISSKIQFFMYHLNKLFEREFDEILYFQNMREKNLVQNFHTQKSTKNIKICIRPLYQVVAHRNS